MNRSTPVLITVSGPDLPGITRELTGVLAENNAVILDIGQAVIHGLLSLSILFEMPAETSHDKTTIKDLLFKATELGMKLEFQVMENTSAENEQFKAKAFRYALTLIGSPGVGPRSLHEVTSALVKFNLNIDQIKRLSDGDFTCVELVVGTDTPLNVREMKSELIKIAKKQGVDIALQSEGLFRRAKRLVVFDMDSTLIQNEVIDELAREHGVYKEVSEVTERAMNGELDFDESLKLRCSKLEGLEIRKMEAVVKKLQLTHGGPEVIRVLKRLGYKVALISGGFLQFANHFKETLGLDYAYANNLEEKNGKLTGQVIPPIVNAQRKADLLDVIAQNENILLDQVIAIGDGSNDLPMLQKAGLGVAFNAKPVVSEQADLSLRQNSLKSILYLLGISGQDLAEILK